MTSDITTPLAGRREWVGLAVLALPALLAATDLSMLFMAAPWLSADLEPSGSQLLWIMDIYGFVLAGLLLVMGTLGDRIGRRRLLLIGSVIFGAASAWAAYATSAEVLIAARALLGIGAATLAPTTLGLVRNMFHDPRQRRIAVGIWAASFSAGFPLGAIAGGLLLERFWWGSVFLVNIPVMVLLLVLAPLLVSESTDPRPGRFDVASAALSMAAVLPVIWGMKEFAEHGWSPAPIAATVVGLLLGHLFVRRQRALPVPLLDVRLFRAPAFSAAIAANSALTLASAALGMLAFQHLQLVLGYRPLTTALWLLPVVASTMLGIALASTLTRWVRPAFVIGGALGIATLGTVATAIYDRQLGDTMPAGVPAEAAEAASGSLGGAIAVAEQLPPDLAAPLVQAAQDAFTSGINLTAAAGATLLTVTALAVTIALRNVCLDQDHRT